MLQIIYKSCEKQPLLKFDDMAFGEYKILHDEIVKFCQDDPFEEVLVSIKSKSFGHATRVSGVISLLRKAECKLQNPDEYRIQNIVTKEDFIMARSFVDHSTSSSFALMGRLKNKVCNPHVLKQRIPDPENVTIDSWSRTKNLNRF